MARPVALGILVSMTLTPTLASASVLSLFSKTAKAISTPTTSQLEIRNSQKMALAEPVLGPVVVSGDTKDSKLLATPNITETMLTPSMGPMGSPVDVMVDIPHNGEIFVYTVRAGDTISGIAEMFNVTQATILAANDLKKGQALKTDAVLTILPISGRPHTVSKGDTFKSIAKKYGVETEDIAFYNDMSIDDMLTIGSDLIIPDAEFSPVEEEVPVKTTKKATVAKTIAIDTSGPVDTSEITVHPLKVSSKVDLGTAILRPVALGSSTVSQLAHGYNGTGADIAAKEGTEIVAALDGTVVLAKTGGYNGGYGNYVIIMSNVNGRTVQTIYAHMKSVDITTGASVKRGQHIGTVGKSGNSTGYHLHFEVRGALNPLTINKKYTGQ